MEITIATEETELRQFAKKSSACDDVERSVDEAESRDFIYILENSCLECNKPLRNYEIKVIPPRYIQERDAYVRSGIVYRRHMCVSCYNAIRSPSRIRTGVSGEYAANRSRKAKVIKSILNGMFLKHQQ